MPKPKTPPKFSTKVLVPEIAALGGVNDAGGRSLLGEVKVSVSKSAGGDYDTLEITATPKGRGHGTIFISGFITGSQTISAVDDVEVEMMEVRDGQDSRGGLSDDDEATCILYGRICSLLGRKGYSVVPNMRDYF